MEELLKEILHVAKQIRFIGVVFMVYFVGRDIISNWRKK